MPEPDKFTAERSMQAFRNRIDAFFGDPRTAKLAAQLGPPPSPRPPTTAKTALRSPLEAALRRLGVDTAGSTLRLEKTLTMHDGRIVAMTGDRAPLGPDADVRVVTTTTTVLEFDKLRVETSVLVFSLGVAK